MKWQLFIAHFLQTSRLFCRKWLKNALIRSGLWYQNAFWFSYAKLRTLFEINKNNASFFYEKVQVNRILSCFITQVSRAPTSASSTAYADAVHRLCRHRPQSAHRHTAVCFQRERPHTRRPMSIGGSRGSNHQKLHFYIFTFLHFYILP